VTRGSEGIGQRAAVAAAICLLAAPIALTAEAAQAPRAPARTHEQLREILLNQPNFRASMRVSNEQRFPEGIVTGRVARSGSTFRLEPGGAFSSRASSEKAIPATESAWIFTPDARSVTVLAPRRRAYRVLDLEGRGDSGDDMTGFALLGLFLTMPYPMLVDGPLREQGVVMIDEGEEMVGGHRCVKIRAATKNRQYGWVLYAATDLRNLIVKVVVDDWPGGEMFSFDLEGLTVALEGISLRADDALFKPPANYRRDDTLHVDLQPHERFARRADPEPEQKPTPNDPPRCGTFAVAPQRVVAGQRVALTVHATDVDGDVLTYTWASTRGRIEGSAASVTFDTTGLAPGVYTITVSVYDGFTAPVQCTAEVRVDAP
jgi:hypothetical protein